MIVPRSWNNQNGWARVLFYLYANGNKEGEEGLSGIVDGPGSTVATRGASHSLASHVIADGPTFSSNGP